MKLSTVILILMVAVVTILSTINTHSVAINLLFWKPEISLILLIYGLLLVGFVAGYLVKGITGYRRKKKNKVEESS